MAKAYLIMTEDIHDPEGMIAYEHASGASLAGSGAAVLAVDMNPQVLEGSWHGSRTVVMEFDSVEAANAWYESEAYEKAKPLRLAAARSNGVIVAGITPLGNHG